MTPGARVAAAIGVMDAVLAGAPAERELTAWARGARYAGSKDRAAVRDLVFSALRRLRSSAARGGGMTGRAVLWGLLAEDGSATASFDGEGHAPAPMAPAEIAAMRAPSAEEALDMPGWLLPELRAAHGEALPAICAAMRDRAPVHLRVNMARGSRAAAAAALAREGIGTRAHPLSPSALEVVDGARALRASAALAGGEVEPQDAASQAVADAVPLRPGARVLDWCAGGGGKALALAARSGGTIWAHDIDAGRMRDLPARARRAGADVRLVPPGRTGGGWDVILVDAPCSGSGAWRRAPEAKWRLTEARLAELVELQATILGAAASALAPGGLLVYATCSLLPRENAGVVGAFARTHDFAVVRALDLTPLDGGDGFHASLLSRSSGRAMHMSAHPDRVS